MTALRRLSCEGERLSLTIAEALTPKTRRCHDDSGLL